MFLYLFGGYSETTKDEHYNLVNTYLEKINPKQILHLGFAEMNYSLDEKINRFKNRIRIPVQILDSRKKEDLEKAKNPLIYVSGGNNHAFLYESIVQNKKLYDLIFNANYYFGDSAGSMVVGSLQREQNDESPLIHGLGLLQNTIIEPHYTERNRQELLEKEMRLGNIHYGIGIGEAAGIKINRTTFPKEIIILGNHTVKVLKSN